MRSWEIFMRYTVDGVPTPSVTEILEAVGLISSRYYKPGAAERGTAVHKMLEDYDVLGIPGEGLFFEAYLSFLRKAEPKIIAIERFVFVEDPRYGGTLDRVMEIDGVTYVVDIKTGWPASWHEIQLAAYARAYGAVDKIAALYLKDGIPRFREYDLKQGLARWDEALERYYGGRK